MAVHSRVFKPKDFQESPNDLRTQHPPGILGLTLLSLGQERHLRSAESPEPAKNELSSRNEVRDDHGIPREAEHILKRQEGIADMKQDTSTCRYIYLADIDGDAV